MVELGPVAIAAAPARPAGIDRNEVTGRHPSYAWSSFFHMARDLMAKDHRLAQPDRAEATMLVVVKVRSADAASGHGNANFTGAGLAGLALFHAQVSGGMYDD